MEVKTIKKWELFTPRNPGRKDTATMNYWDLLNFYEELSKVQAKTMYLQEEELIITNI